MAVYEQVSGRFLAPDGSPLSGSVVFTPAFLFARDSQAVTLPAPVVGVLESDGRVEVSLLVPGDGVEPSAWGWRACPRLRHAGASVKLADFGFELVAGAPVNLATQLPVPDPVTGEYMTRGADGVGIAGIESVGGELVIRLTDGTENRLPLPAGGAGGVSPEALAPLQEADRALGERVAALEAVEPVPGPAGPQGERGEPGPPGPQGEPGPPGADGVSLEAAQELFASKAEVDRRISQIAVDTSPFKTGGRYYSPVTYYWPDYYNGDASEWGRVLRFGNDLGITILNRSSGDWEQFDQDFLTQGRLAKAAGARRVIFYVKTQYGAAGNPAKWGQDVPNAEKYTKDYIMQQLAYCKQHYPDVFEGVFLDEFINGWGDHALRMPWYMELVDAIRAEYGPDFLIVGNCGSNCDQFVLNLDVDVFMSYENTAERYLNPPQDSPIHPAHMAAYPSTRFWHVVHDVTHENYKQVFAQAEKFGVGHLYITDGKLVIGEGGQWDPAVNPYRVAPGDWITDVIKAWLAGILDTRLLAERTATRVTEVAEESTQGQQQLAERISATESRVQALEEAPAAGPLAVQDTGWRDVTAYTSPPASATVQGKLLLRRVGPVVYLYAHGYTFGGTHSTQTFFKPELCAYTAPPQTGGAQMRHAGQIIAGDRTAPVFIYDWLTPTTFRMSGQSQLIAWGIASWFTDTPFPNSPLGAPA